MSGIKYLFILLSFACVSQAQIIQHQVQRGETIGSVAKLYGITQAELLSLNPQLTSIFYIGVDLDLRIGYEQTIYTKAEFLKSQHDKKEAENLFNQKKYKKAAKCYSELIACNKEPNLDILYFNRGMCYYNAKKYKDAMYDFNKTVAITQSKELSENASNMYSVAQQAKLARDEKWANIGLATLASAIVITDAAIQVNQNNKAAKKQKEQAGKDIDYHELYKSDPDHYVENLRKISDAKFDKDMQQAGQYFDALAIDMVQNPANYDEEYKSMLAHGNYMPYEEFCVLRGQYIEEEKAKGHDILKEQQEQAKEQSEYWDRRRKLDNKRWIEKNKMHLSHNNPDKYNTYYQNYNEIEQQIKENDQQHISNIQNYNSSNNSSGMLSYIQQNYPNQNTYASSYSPTTKPNQEYQKNKTDNYTSQHRSVTLYRRDGASAKEETVKGELYKKSGSYYVKVDGKYYSVSSSNWSAFDSYISLGSGKYFNLNGNKYREQFDNSNVAKAEYLDQNRQITLYRRDGDKAIVDYTKKPLYKKGATYYILINNTFYSVGYSNWGKFNRSINYGGGRYFNL